MKKKYFQVLAPLFLLASSAISNAQTFVGGSIDNYSGIQSVIVNPANVAASGMKFEFNLFSTSVFIGNDFLTMDLSDIKNLTNNFDFDTDVEISPMDKSNFFGNIDILGPSVLFNLNEKNSLALSTRARVFFNIHNIEGELYELLNSNEDIANFDISMDNLSGSVHTWAELGLTYGRVILTRNNHILKVGATFKYLSGAGGTYGFSPLMTAKYDSNNESLTTTGSLEYGYTSNFDLEKISFSDIKGGSGFGADLGIVYEFRDVNGSESPYKLRVGLSVTDIGTISYKDASTFMYDMDATIDATQFEEKDLGQVLEDNYTGTEVMQVAKFGLPTTIQFFADYSLTKRFFVSAHGAISAKKPSKSPVSNIINSISVTPRFQMRWLSVYSPLSVRKYDSSLAWGVGVRAGPVTIGSGSIFTNLISKSSRSADVYIGVKVPIYR